MGGWGVPCTATVADQSTLLVRPEDVEVGLASPGWGRAVVTRRSFQGDRVQLTLSTADGANLNADVARDHTAKLGDTVGIRIAPERLMSSHESNAPS